MKKNIAAHIGVIVSKNINHDVIFKIGYVLFKNIFFPKKSIRKIQRFDKNVLD